MLRTKRTIIRAMEWDDLPLIAQWRSDPSVYDAFYEYLPLSTHQQQKWFERQAGNPSEMNFVIADPAGKAIGTVSLYHIDLRNRRAEWGRLLIGDKEYREKGPIGLDVEALMLQYAFEHMNLHKLTCEVLVNNPRVIDLHKQFGFIEEGRLKDHVFKSDAYVDTILLALFEDAYRKEKNGGFLGRLLS